MTAGTEPLVTAEMLRDFVDGLKARGDLDVHPLTKLLAPLPEFERYVGMAGGAGHLGDQIARGMRAIWRQRFMPPVLSAERLVKWNAFFILEVMYFFPRARGLPFPDTLKDAAVLLCDAEHLALIVADGDAEQAARLIEGNPVFWARLIPASMTPAEQTLHSRRNASLGKLARELSRQVCASGQLTSRTDTTPPAAALQPSSSARIEPEVDAPAVVEIAAFDSGVSECVPEPLTPGAARLLEALGWPRRCFPSSQLPQNPTNHPG